MTVPSKNNIEIAKLALDYLAALQTSNAHNYVDLISRQTGAAYGKETFEQIFNVVFNAIEARVQADDSDRTNLGC